ncbi:MAG: PilZ domain-containing protein [Candidatus Competibacteraceae bacterium]|nr:MAG: PilZ domain-containing protein [Candidatus Competibacteraceae bacterium]
MPGCVEKRQFARTEINAAIQYRIAGTEILNEGVMGNIGGGGVLLWTEQELPVGTTLYLFIHSDELAEIELEAMATIVRVDPTKKDGWFGYGCRFEALYNNPHVG